ncbi:MAG: hypothetical protein FD174_2439 [Geobacteraceae bacterium]|nr:MAG: hypothetical protein FD174_2439 [Geobacteraceae bacterium]
MKHHDTVGDDAASGQQGRLAPGGRPIRWKVLVPLTLALLSFMGVFMFIADKFLKQEIRSELLLQQKTADVLLKELIAQRGELMDVAIDQISRDKALQQAMMRGDRASLLHIVQPVFNALLAEHEITHFYFHDTKGINVLRVHQPERFGDQIDRFTLKRSMKIGKFSYGIELGPLGTFTLRTVAPWYADGRLIGYIELGEEIDQLIRKLGTLTQVELMMTIYKSYLNREAWESGMKMLGRQGQWDHLPEVVVIDQTMPKLFPKVSRFLVKKGPYSPEEFEINVDERHYHGRILPLRDAADRVVGDFVIVNDVTDQKNIYRKSIALVAAFCFLTVSALFVVCFIILGRAERAYPLDSP